MFLQRTLSYMKERRTKGTKGSDEQRRKFKLDSMLDRRKTQMEEVLQKDDTDEDSYRYLVLTALLISIHLICFVENGSFNAVCLPSKFFRKILELDIILRATVLME